MSRRVEPHRSQTSTDANVYEPGPNFVLTMSPPPYDADKPPDYSPTTCAVAGSEIGETGAVGGVALDDDVKPSPDSTLPPAYDNYGSTGDQV